MIVNITAARYTARQSDLHPTTVAMLASQHAGLVCFWDLVEETMVHQIQAHTSAVCSVAMHPEAKCMVSASNDGTAKVWQPHSSV